MSSKLDRVIKAMTAQVRKILEAEFPDAKGKPLPALTARKAKTMQLKRVVKDGKQRLVKASAKPALAVAPKTGKSAPQTAAAALRKKVLAVLGQSKKVNLSASQVFERVDSVAQPLWGQRKVAAALKALCASGDAKMEGARSGAKYRRLYPLG